MNGKSKSILKSIIAFVMALAMVLGAVPLPFVPESMVVQAASFNGDGTAEKAVYRSCSALENIEKGWIRGELCISIYVMIQEVTECAFGTI